MANVKLALVPWIVPNFVRGQMPPRPRQEGIQDAPSFALSGVDADTLAQMCDDFRAEIFRKAGKPDPVRGR